MKTNYAGARIELPSELFVEELSFDKYSYEPIKDTIIATTTMYPENNGIMDPANELRSRLALEKIRKANELGYDIVILDGGSSDGWRTKARDLGAVLVDENLSNYPGHHFMGRGRRQILDFAGNYGKHKVVAWIEPEKHPLITSEKSHVSPLGLTARTVYEGLADIVIPRRRDSLQSYPLQQQFEELLGSIHITEQMRSFVEKHSLGDPLQIVPYLDLWIGPRVISKERALQEFLDYKGEIKVLEGEKEISYPHDQWESIFVPVWNAMLDGKIVKSVAVDYIHPQDQTKFESGNPIFNQKRIDQLVKLLIANERVLRSYEGRLTNQ